MRKRAWLIWTIGLLLVAPPGVMAQEEEAPADDPAAAEDDQDKQRTPAEWVEALQKLRPSVVIVEYHLQYDKGEAPWIGARFITEERPYEEPGYLYAPTMVASGDLMVHPRFIKEIKVRHGDDVVDAEIAGYVANQPDVVLKLARPLKGAVPLKFKTDAEPPYKAVGMGRRSAEWTMHTAAMPPLVAVTDAGHTYRGRVGGGLVIDKDDNPVAVVLGNTLPADDSWKVSPDKWPLVAPDRMAALLDGVKKAADTGLLRVKLHFRSPKKGTYDRYGDESVTELNTLALLTDAQTLLVLANLDPKTTARLERIMVHPVSGEAAPANFQLTFKDWGCLLAKLDKPLPGPLKLSDKDVLSIRRQLLTAAEVRVNGEQRIDYYLRSRIDDYDLGWKRKVFISLQTEQENRYVFDLDGKLLALPVARRQKVAARSRWGGDGETRMTPAAHLAEVLADPAAHADKTNVPLTEEQEARLAWMGLELQSLDPELARINKVSDITNDGRIGAMVSYVYPDSPAAEAGIEIGNIVIRLHIEGEPKPLDVQIVRFGRYMENFPWERLDEVPDQYYDQIPKPWPPVETSLTRALTDLGFGKKYTAEVYADGKLVRKQMAIEQSPPHYDTAEKFENESLGLTVRNLTYEVRRYFQKTPADPGVIISKIEPGSKASVGGLKPYELITGVNDQPVKSVEDFERLIQGQEELRISVLRMTRGRIVKLKLDKKIGAGDDAAEEAEDEGADDDADASDKDATSAASELEAAVEKLEAAAEELEAATKE